MVGLKIFLVVVVLLFMTYIHFAGGNNKKD